MQVNYTKHPSTLHIGDIALQKAGAEARAVPSGTHLRLGNFEFRQTAGVDGFTHVKHVATLQTLDKSFKMQM